MLSVGGAPISFGRFKAESCGTEVEEEAAGAGAAAKGDSGDAAI